MNDTSGRKWKVWVDTGGTFTDCIAITPQGKRVSTKVLSSGTIRARISKVESDCSFEISSPCGGFDNSIRGFSFSLAGCEEQAIAVEHFSAENKRVTLSSSFPYTLKEGDLVQFTSLHEAPILAAHFLTGTPGDCSLPPIDFRLATTKGTNALLERKGEQVALFITKGFEDLLKIGTQQREDLFALDIVKHEQLYTKVFGIPERLDKDGNVLLPLDVQSLKQMATEARMQGITSAAVCFMHSYINPIHEDASGKILEGVGFESISLSSQLSPLIKYLPKSETAVVNAYLSKVLDDYLMDVSRCLENSSLHIMTSAGGLISEKSFTAKDSLLSGPAGGVVGASCSGKKVGENKVIAFDMGGTSTDVSRFDGEYEYIFEHRVGDAHLFAPALAIETVAAGGGSICSFDGAKMQVGPESAGAIPGPACYGAGGPLTLTDVNLLLGRLQPEKVSIPIDVSLSESKWNNLFAQIQQASDKQLNESSVLSGFLEIANERMADAARSISVRKGYDPAEYSLVAFGGAGPQHACGVADKLGISSVIVPAEAGLLSAMGLGNALIERFSQRQILRPFEKVSSSLPTIIDSLIHQAYIGFEQEGIARTDVIPRRIIVNMRFSGQESSLGVKYSSTANLLEDFFCKYQAVFTHLPESRNVEVESVRVILSEMPVDWTQAHCPPNSHEPRHYSIVNCWFDGQWKEVYSYHRENLMPGMRVAGPAMILDSFCTIVIETGWTGNIYSDCTLVLDRESTEGKAVRFESEAVELELFTNRFSSVVAEMGEVLQRTAISTNVKERLDFSCALLDKRGELIVNAPHIPVHLGAMGLCVRGILAHSSLKKGDVVITNHPAFGGSHLPDITVVTPVYMEDNLLGFIASRAHHAEIGGITPGSMPTNATNLAQEGVVIPPTHIVKGGVACWGELLNLLENSEHPSRAPHDNLADIKAAVAANNKGASILVSLAQKFGANVLDTFMEHIKAYSCYRLQKALENYPNRDYKATEYLDDRTLIEVSLEKRGKNARIRISSGGSTHPGNLNATPAVANSAVIYFLRLLLNEELPLNEGFFRAVELEIEEGIFNPEFSGDPTASPAVFGGNVETSQRLVDALMKSISLRACSQGTMNNVVFGNENTSYYETICGGSGAGPEHDGASAVHTHMTNTRITDPEIMEFRYPVILRKFAVRQGSGGEGFHKGGNGVTREIEFTRKLELSVLSQHRNQLPYGLNGGGDGRPGSQLILRRNGSLHPLEGIDSCTVFPGDLLLIETPGGGGWGKSD